MTNDELIALSAKCEHATGPDRALDAAIAFAAGWKTTGSRITDPQWYNQDRRCIGELVWQYGPVSADLPAFTASLDAAMQLVPEGQMVELAYGLTRLSDARVDLKHAGLGHTPALALCAAALKAMASVEQENA